MSSESGSPDNLSHDRVDRHRTGHEIYRWAQRQHSVEHCADRLDETDRERPDTSVPSDLRAGRRHWFRPNSSRSRSTKPGLTARGTVAKETTAGTTSDSRDPGEAGAAPWRPLASRCSLSLTTPQAPQQQPVIPGRHRPDLAQRHGDGRWDDALHDRPRARGFRRCTKTA